MAMLCSFASHAWIRYPKIGVLMSLAPVMAFVLCHGGSAAAGGPVFIGAIGAARGDARLAAIGSSVPLDIDPSSVIRGDKLKIHTSSSPLENGGSGAGGMAEAGEITVVSATGEPPMGVVTRASREIFGEARLSFALALDEQSNVFLPFLGSVADTFLGRPAKTPLRAAPIDVTDPYGDRTQGTGAVFEKLRGHLCARPQFDCVDRERLAEELWRAGVGVSRGIGESVLAKLRMSLGVDVIITGHMREEDGRIDLILLARSADPARDPRQVWRRFRLPGGRLGLPTPIPSAVTAAYSEPSAGRLRLALKDVPSAQGMSAIGFSCKDITGWARGLGARPEDVYAAGFFVRLDGVSLNMDSGGVFHDGIVTAGKRRITFGFTPTMTRPDGERESAPAPVEKSFEINVGEGGLAEVGLVGKIEKGYAIVAADVAE